jgi:hypothetical protein
VRPLFSKPATHLLVSDPLVNGLSRRSIRRRYKGDYAMTSIEVLRLIDRIRHDIPHNQMVMCLCDECERLILAPPMVKRRDPLMQAEIQRRIENSRPRPQTSPARSS